MRKLNIEVKTIYSICFDFHDFCKIFAEAKNDVTRLNAFDGYDLDDQTMGNIRNCYLSLDGFSRQASTDLKYIVNKLGFDGVDNYGCFKDKDKKEYSISVYNRGADI